MIFKSGTIALILFSTHLSAQNIIGEWKYVAYRYLGREYNISDPRLDLRFKFDSSGTSTLFWTRGTMEERCERKADYLVSINQPAKPVLYQKVVWVNPENHFSCARDPDMKLNQETLTPFETIGSRLELELTLSGEPFFYILEAVPLSSRGDLFNERQMDPNLP